MPVYNTPPEWIEQSIDSCLNQTFREFELIIVDNESTNEFTLKKVQEYEGIKNVKLVKCPRQPGKRGVSLAINMGIDHSSFDFIARMDSDDWMYPTRLEKQYLYMSEHTDVSILGAQIKIIQSKQITNHPEIVDLDYIRKTRSSWFINHPTVMFRKDIFRIVDKYSESPEIFPEDLELWTRCLLNGLKIRNLKECLLNYNLHGKNASVVDATQLEWKKNLASYINRII